MQSYGNITILIVDDVATTRLTEKVMLETHFPDIKTVEAQNGKEALERVKNEHIDLILLDIVMPDMDGFEVAKRIENEFKDRKIPIIFLTAHLAHDEFKEKGFEVGAVDYMVRPIDTNLLINRIRLYLTLIKQTEELRRFNSEATNSLELINRYVIASKTDLKGIITEVTDAFCDIAGYSREELLGKPHNIVRHPDMSGEVFHEMWSMIKKGVIWSGEIKNRRKDGSYYWVHAVVSPLIDINGKLIGYISTRQDITRIKHQQQEINEKQELLDQETASRLEAEELSHEILDSSENLIAVANSEKPLFLNSAMLEFMDLSSIEEFFQKYQDLNTFFATESEAISDFQFENSWLDTILHIAEKRFFKMRPVRSDIDYTYNLKIKRLESKEERYLFVFTDVTLLEEERSYYEELATHDTLTNIYNRFYFIDALEREFATTKRYGHPLSLMLIDIDHFKRINDNFGHTVGDEVLKEFAAILSKRVRSSDVFARWGGEEFILLLPSTTVGQAMCVAESMRASVDNNVFDEVGSVTCSIGVSQIQDGDDFNRLISRSDEALYRAKEEGRNRVISL